MFGPQVHQCCLLLDFLKKIFKWLDQGGGARGFGPLTWPQEKGGEEEKEKRKVKVERGKGSKERREGRKDQH